MQYIDWNRLNKSFYLRYLMIDFDLGERECLWLYENLTSLALAVEIKTKVDQIFSRRHLKILSSAYNYYWGLKQYKTARSYAAKLKTLTGASRWRRKLVLTKLATFLLSPPSIQKKEVATSQVASTADFDPWKKYVLALEGEVATSDLTDLAHPLRSLGPKSAL